MLFHTFFRGVSFPPAKKHFLGDWRFFFSLSFFFFELPVFLDFDNDYVFFPSQDRLLRRFRFQPTLADHVFSRMAFSLSGFWVVRVPFAVFSFKGSVWFFLGPEDFWSGSHFWKQLFLS